MSLGFECLGQKKILVFPISFPESYGRSIGIFRVVRIVALSVSAFSREPFILCTSVVQAKLSLLLSALNSNLPLFLAF